jgi:hypothetical protein
VFNQVGLTVKKATAGAQQPWLASSPIAGNFYFFNNGPVTITLPAPAPPPPPAARPPSALAPATQSDTRFDGPWNVDVSCLNASDGALGYSYQFTAHVTNGLMHGEYRTPGTPGYLRLDGSIQPDGSAMLVADGLSGNPIHTMGREPALSPFRYHVKAHFAGASGSGNRVEQRECTLGFSKL